MFENTKEASVAGIRKIRGRKVQNEVKMLGEESRSRGPMNYCRDFSFSAPGEEEIGGF